MQCGANVPRKPCGGRTTRGARPSRSFLKGFLNATRGTGAPNSQHAVRPPRPGRIPLESGRCSRQTTNPMVHGFRKGKRAPPPMRRLHAGTTEAAQTRSLCWVGGCSSSQGQTPSVRWGPRRSCPDRPSEVDESLTPRTPATWAQWLPLLCGALCRLETDLSVHADITCHSFTVPCQGPCCRPASRAGADPALLSCSLSSSATARKVNKRGCP